MKEIEEAIAQITQRCHTLDCQCLDCRADKTALAALRIVENIGRLIREAKKKWYNDLSYQERDLTSIDEFTIGYIQSKFSEFMKQK